MALWTLALVAKLALAADAPAEAQLVLQSLRAGERARVEKALGDPALLPLYRGDFALDPGQRTVTGRFSLTVTARQAADALYLRATPNAAHPGAVKLSQPRVNGGKVQVSQPEPSLFEVKLDPPLKVGEQLTLEFELKAKVPKLPSRAGGGLGALTGGGEGGDYGAFSASDDVVSLVGLVPMLVPLINGKPAEAASGIGDLGTAEPSNLVVSLSVPSGWRAVGTGLQLGEVPTGNGLVRYAYGAAAAREMPLLAIKNAKVGSKRFGDIEVEATLLAGDAADLNTVLDDAGQAVQLLDQHLGPYPYKTLRVVEMRLINGAGGMEFPGLITVSAMMLSDSVNPFEALGLSDAQTDAAKSMFGGQLKTLMRDTLEFTIAHEVGHQYAAMLVGSDPVAEPIADEPLTQHLALLVLEWRHGKAAADALRNGQLKASYQLHRMMGGADARAERPTGDFESNREYAALIYGKAPLLFDALRATVGTTAWEQALRTYFDTWRYRFVTARTLTDLVAKQNPSVARQVKDLRRRWWEEARGDEDIGAYDLDSMLTEQLGNQGMDKAAFEEFRRAMKSLGIDE